MRVYAVTGVPPEIQAYAMAKYSRSAQSMQESIGELSRQRAAAFLNTFYFQYGHRSIADLAHLALAIEDISLLAAIRVVDEALWDGQERSTRYQDFGKSGYHLPESIAASAHVEQYRATADGLFARYHALTKQLTDLLVEHYPCPPDMDAAAHKRTLRARAFDVTRALLPLATHTSVGQVTSARVLERQIARLLADPLPEAQAIGAALRDACSRPPYDVTREKVWPALALLGGHPEAEAAREALAPAPLAPTLVKYAQAAPYATETYDALRHAATCYLGKLPVDRTRLVELGDPCSPEEEITATLLYRADTAGHSYRQAQAVARDLSEAQRREILDLSFAGRGPHDEWLREHQAGQALAFDLLVDVGAFRDLHRHRRCIQIIQPFGPNHGYDHPEETLALGLGLAAPAVIRTGIADELTTSMDGALAVVRELTHAFPEEAAYLLPLGARVRALFKMDVAQAAYIVELRTGVTGHFSYRRIAWLMYQALAERHPSLARHIRVTDPRAEVDLLRR